MADSFFEIEQRKDKAIALFFAFLIFFYFFSSLLVWVILKNIVALAVSSRLVPYHLVLVNLKEIFILFIFTFLLGLFHWISTKDQMVEKILGLLNVEPLKKEDKYHQVLDDIMEEISVSAGGVRFEKYVVPASALNAFSLSDFNKRHVIGVTEGLLVKLNRCQLQTVLGHEAAHILSGDSLSATVACSLFGIRSAGIKKWIEGIDPGGLGYYMWYFTLVYVLVSFMDRLGSLLNVFISRQREYRADAVSARLTRDPLSLAEALYIISRNARGENLRAESLSSIFIMNPGPGFLEEKEGLFSDLFSTHPPVQKRIDILLRMAGADRRTLEDTARQADKQDQEVQVSHASAKNTWYAADENRKWSGPFSLDQLMKLPWLVSGSWVKRAQDDAAAPAFEHEELKSLFRTSEQDQGPFLECPCCGHGIRRIEYEGNSIGECLSCLRVLVKRSDLMRILMRKEKAFSPRNIKMAELILRDSRSRIKTKSIDTVHLIPCPSCGERMKRIYFNWNLEVDTTAESKVSDLDFLTLVVDKCIWCDQYYLEPDKLEILQYIYERYGQKVG